MPTTTLMPLPKQHFDSALGTPLIGGALYTFAAGTSTPKQTFTDVAGSTPHENPIRLNARGEPPGPVFWSGNYRVELRDAFGKLIYTVDNYNTDPAGVWDVKNVLLSLLGEESGAALIGFMLDAAGATIQTVQDKLRETVSVFGFMTPQQIDDVRSGLGKLDVTAPIQAAVDYVYSKNLGTLYFPPGTYSVTSIVRNWDAVRTLDIVGAGERAVLFNKFDDSTTPIFDWSASENILETYSNFQGFTIIGKNKAHHGIRITKCARFEIRSVYIGGCDRAIDNQGSLVWYGQGLTLQGNNYGLYTDRSPTAAGGFIYPNAITLRDSRLCFNTKYAISARFANGMRIRDCDVESNGTSQDQSTGGVFFAQTHVEAGLGSISLDGTWFEGNKGWAFTMDSANNLTSLSIKDIQFIGSESGRACRVINARSVLIQAVMAVTPGDTVSVAADHFILENSTISAVIDTSTRSTWTNVITANDPIGEGGFSQGITVSNGKPLTLSWARGAGKATLTPDTNNGHLDYATASGLHRFKNQIGFFEPIPLANARALSFFVDAADGKAKFKDAGGVVNLLY